MYRLFSRIPILRGEGGGGLIKSAKKMFVCEYVIFSIDTF